MILINRHAWQSKVLLGMSSLCGVATFVSMLLGYNGIEEEGVFMLIAISVGVAVIAVVLICTEVEV